MLAMGGMQFNQKAQNNKKKSIGKIGSTQTWLYMG